MLDGATGEAARRDRAAALDKLARRVADGEDITLMCHCRGRHESFSEAKRCHGDGVRTEVLRRARVLLGEAEADEGGGGGADGNGGDGADDDMGEGDDDAGDDGDEEGEAGRLEPERDDYAGGGTVGLGGEGEAAGEGTMHDVTIDKSSVGKEVADEGEVLSLGIDGGETDSGESAAGEATARGGGGGPTRKRSAAALERKRTNRDFKKGSMALLAESYDEELLAPDGAAAAVTVDHGLGGRGDGDDVGGSETGVVDDEGDVVMQPARANEVADKRPREEDGDGHDDVGGSSAGARAQTAGDTRSGHSGTGQKRSRGAKKTGNQKKNVREGYKRAGREDAARGER